MTTDDLNTTSSLQFVIRNDALYQKEKPYVLRYQSADIPQSNITLETVDNVPISQMRTRQFSLDKNGFQLLNFNSSMYYTGFEDVSLIETVYFREIREIIRTTVKAQDVFIFDWAVCGTAHRSHSSFTYCANIYIAS
jgi:hypothetical protein